MSRAEDLAARLAEVEQRLSAACAAAGRTRDDVELVAVTKFHPTQDVEVLRDLGVRAFGESRDQEARDKAARVSGVVWHFVGRLQSNKAASVASYSTVVESVDRLPLVQALSTGAVKAGRELEVLLQVSLDGDPDRGGAGPADLPSLAEAVAAADGLHLRGLMAVAPQDVDPDGAFAVLRELSVALRQDHPDADRISAGMTGDLEPAVAHGSTSVRVGTALLGRRPPASR